MSQTKVLTTQIHNPVKFRVYRSTAQNSGSTPARVQFNTATFDTSSSVDLVTNVGRFTAPVTGYYQFNWHIELAASYSYNISTLYKNGARTSAGTDLRATAAQGGGGGSDFIPLTAGDYVEIFVESNATIAMNVADSTRCYFSGYLVSTT